MKLVVGLGNPGEKFRLHRHNVGFMVVDLLAERLGASLNQKGFAARYGMARLGVVPVLLAEPQTYMNLSGTAVRKLIDYYRLAMTDLIVVYDDLDLPFRTLRLKQGGGHGGHKGLRSIIDHLGGADFLRVRLGIGKPPCKEMTENYVLHPFAEEERAYLTSFLATATEAVTDIIASGIQAAMNKYHVRPQQNASRRFNDEKA